jgi:hypothetical protein
MRSLSMNAADGGRIDFFNSVILKPGDFCCEELLVVEHLEGGNRKRKWEDLDREDAVVQSSNRNG